MVARICREIEEPEGEAEDDKTELCYLPCRPYSLLGNDYMEVVVVHRFQTPIVCEMLLAGDGCRHEVGLYRESAHY